MLSSLLIGFLLVLVKNPSKPALSPDAPGTGKAENLPNLPE